MKGLLLALVFLAVVPCRAQTPCGPAQLPDAAQQVHSTQQALKQFKSVDAGTRVPVEARDLIMQLKDELTCAADAALTGAGPSVNPIKLQQSMALVLHANPPQPPNGTVIAKDDHRFDEALGSYGHNLSVEVSRPAAVAGMIEVEFSINIECGYDTVLLFYALHNGAWKRQMRWQAPPLNKVSDAFGDFVLTALWPSRVGKAAGPLVVVAHGKPWCMSRFSGFAMDVLSPASDPNAPKVLWHIARGYSRGDADLRLRASRDTFELRLNSPTMDVAASYERPVIYHYQIDEHGNVRRIQPIASNARGFVEEWLIAPWSEAQGFLAEDADAALQQVHDQFDPPLKKDDQEFFTHSYGPVRACKAPKTFQVQIDSTLEKMVPGGPGGESIPRPSQYFHVRETGNGYVMISAPTVADSACTGPNLMPVNKK